MTEKVTTIYEDALAVIEKAAPLLSDDKQKEYFESVSKSIKTAASMVEVGKDSEKNDEKVARLCDAAIKYVNQLMFILFRENKIDEELGEQFRALVTPEYTGEQVRAYEKARDERIEEINNMHQAIVDEQKDLDIFTAIIAGMSKEEAEKRMAEYEAQVKEATKR